MRENTFFYKHEKMLCKMPMHDGVNIHHCEELSPPRFHDLISLSCRKRHILQVLLTIYCEMYGFFLR